MIATGSAPVDVKAWPRDGDTIINSDDAVRLARIPKRLLVIGGGVIGLEFATVYKRLGADVLVVEMMPQILTGTDAEIGKTLGRILKKQGIEIMLGTKVGAIEKQGKNVRATLNGEGTGGKDETREFDMVLVAVGRRPVTDNLNLQAAGLELGEGGFIAVDRQQRTKVPNIFAVGDVTGAAAARAPRDEAGRHRRRGDRRRQVGRVRSGCGAELHLHRSRGRDGRSLRGRGKGGRLRGAHRQIPARRERPRAHDESRARA